MTTKQRHAADAKRFRWLAREGISLTRGYSALVVRSHQETVLFVQGYTKSRLFDWRKAVDGAMEKLNKIRKS